MLLYNVVAYPWECMTMYDPTKMSKDMRNMFDAVGDNMYFDSIVHPVIKDGGLVHRAFVTVMSKRPELVLGVVSRVVLRSMVLTLYFTDEFGDDCALNSVSFRTIGTEGICLDSAGV